MISLNVKKELFSKLRVSKLRVSKTSKENESLKSVAINSKLVFD